MTTEILRFGGGEVASSEPAIWARLLERFEDELPPEAARAILGLKFGGADLDRIEALTAKSQGGSLSPAEGREFENYLNVSHALMVMQTKARKRLGVVTSGA